ncbi:MAG: antibiotic biosynthesis monooxygenase [Planctomycetes bacterium]|nr:antibiotic biosynthesis monooxygenase [Planctomycetota bacterium]
MIHVIATITAKPGTRAQVLEAFKWVTPLVRAEDGCIEYQATVDVPTTVAVQDGPRPDVVVVVEKWASVETLYAHSASAHMTEYRTKVKDYVLSVRLVVTEAV